MSMESWLERQEWQERLNIESKKLADGATEYMKTNQDQPPQIANDHPPIWNIVVMDMLNRDHVGRKRYGVPLQPHNGRDVLRDAYEEALDLCAYLRQAIYERDGK